MELVLLEVTTKKTNNHFKGKNSYPPILRRTSLSQQINTKEHEKYSRKIYGHLWEFMFKHEFP